MYAYECYQRLWVHKYFVPVISGRHHFLEVFYQGWYISIMITQANGPMALWFGEWVFVWVWAIGDCLQLFHFLFFSSHYEGTVWACKLYYRRETFCCSIKPRPSRILTTSMVHCITSKSKLACCWCDYQMLVWLWNSRKLSLKYQQLVGTTNPGSSGEGVSGNTCLFTHKILHSNFEAMDWKMKNCWEYLLLCEDWMCIIFFYFSNPLLS